MTREEMKRLSRVCAAKMEPRPLRQRFARKDGTRELLREHYGTAAYWRDPRRAPAPYPIIKTDRVSGKIKSIVVATPTAPLRRVR